MIKKNDDQWKLRKQGCDGFFSPTTTPTPLLQYLYFIKQEIRYIDLEAQAACAKDLKIKESREQ